MSVSNLPSEKKSRSFVLLLAAVALFGLSQPGIVFGKGCFILSYFSVLPVFLLTRRESWKTVWLYGMLYGIGSYCFFAYWLCSFHPMGIAVISCLYGVYLAVAFPLLKAAWVLHPKYGWLAQWIVWCAYEFVKTLGFTGFQYGVTAYSHWQILPLVQCAEIAGVWGLSALITFPSAWLSAIVSEYAPVASECAAASGKTLRTKIFLLARRHAVSASVWAAVFLLSLLFGLFVQKDYSGYEKRSVVLIQQNSDPWRGGKTAYRRDLNTLMSLSDTALAENPSADLVVWPETAFVPRIEYHYTQRPDREYFEIVNTLLEYINEKEVPFLLGNDHAELGFSHDGEYRLLDYNAALLFVPGKNVIPPAPEKYFKMHLVPFTEYFPFEKLFPGIYRLLLNGDTHLWEKGSDPHIFSVNGLSFGTPICFEDTFGNMGRMFVRNGARVFVNISNDAWSKSLACQYQHLSMAVFRSIENRIPSVRATASGQTCIIDPNGKVTAMAEPFCETYIAGDIPVCAEGSQTVYTKYGDYAGWLFVLLSALLFAAGGIRCAVKSVLLKKK